jgi:hypothetical protein
MKFIIFRRNGDLLGEKLSSYESLYKDDSSANRDSGQAEPKAIHLELPEDLDEDCVDPVWMELETEHIVTLREPTEELEGLYVTIPSLMGWGLVENADKVLAKRQVNAQSNLDAIRILREPLLINADHSINEVEDNGESALTLRQWRKALRECTDTLKKVNGDAKLSCENLVPSEFEFPSKPE